ncbi:AMP-binding protein [Chitinophaga sp. Mgbs1]|uniref:AMP-binding protein n=1 Tax=Chitinophaga solisilvae TaxID=1233460 RepID=A0A9Q5GV97_9BACT|nr:AMP-binding protein [Chitinophaga solisilvae]
MLRIIDYLTYHASVSPFKTAFIISGKGLEPDQRISYGKLEEEVLSQAMQLAAHHLHGKRVVLVYQDVLSFIVSFFACHYSGAVPVPVPYVQSSRQFARLQHIIDDAMPAAILCRKATARYLEDAAALLLFTDGWNNPAPVTESQPHDIALLQYTSGSTSDPKGVVISHQNLIHNQEMIAQTFRCDSQSVIFSWLPFHHDMGLIGNILHTVFMGCTGVLMDPADFIQQPLRWLEGISRYKATHSGGPNFAYDLCTDRIPADKVSTLDLSSWKVAFNGSEVIRPSTLERFTAHFAAAGYNPHACTPCYGLAEATLLVAVYHDEQQPVCIHEDRQLIGVGAAVPGITVKIISAATGQPVAAGEEGEICIAGDSVTVGYWRRNNQAYFYEQDGLRFLRTGDLGFFHQEQLFVQGRLKEMMIIRGKNIYPTDVEQAVAGSNGDIENNGVAVFCTDAASEQVVAVIEIKRSAVRSLEPAIVIAAARRAMTGRFGITPHDILLVSPFTIPRTTSGKLQRSKCVGWYQEGLFKSMASLQQLPEEIIHTAVADVEDIAAHPDSYKIQDYLLRIVSEKTGSAVYAGDVYHTDLTDLGLESMQQVELLNKVNRELDLNINISAVMENNTISALSALLENMLWLKNRQISDNEVII